MVLKVGIVLIGKILHSSISFLNQINWLLFSVKDAIQYCTIILGETKKFEVIGDHTLKIKPLPPVLDPWNVLLTITSNKQLMAIQTSRKKCLVYENRDWFFHSNIPGQLMPEMVCSLPIGTYVMSFLEVHFLEKDSTKWDTRKWEKLDDFGLPIWIEFGLPLSNHEMIILRDMTGFQKVLEKLNLDTMMIEPFVKLKTPRYVPAICVFNGNLFVTGGFSEDRNKLVSTEIISLSDLNAKQEADLNVPRAYHSMAIVQLKSGMPKLIVFGGDEDDARVEEWDEKEKKWKFSKLTAFQSNISHRYCYNPSIELSK